MTMFCIYGLYIFTYCSYFYYVNCVFFNLYFLIFMKFDYLHFYFSVLSRSILILDLDSLIKHLKYYAIIHILSIIILFSFSVIFFIKLIIDDLHFISNFWNILNISKIFFAFCLNAMLIIIFTLFLPEDNIAFSADLLL